MLIEFSVENFRSFRDKVTLSLAATSDKAHQDNTSEASALDGQRLLRSAMVLGANASGKSNLFFAMALLRSFVVGSHQHQKGTLLNHQPFAFDPDYKGRPTRFEISFIQSGIRYRYTLSYDSKAIVEEELVHYPNGRPALIFSRHGSEFEFTRDKKEQEVLSRRTLENVLYLSSSVQFNYSGTLPAYEWFFGKLIVFDNMAIGPLIEQVVDRMNHDKKFRQKALKALEVADLGIVGFEGSIRKIPLNQLHGKVPPQVIGMMTLMGAEDMKQSDLKVKHSTKDRKGVERTTALPLGVESEGTKRLLALILPVIESLSQGGTLFIDELDTKLHHKLSAWLVDMFHDPAQNREGAQLVFNTHDLEHLDLTRFRRDQIWFTEKDPEDGHSTLYSLSEYGERKDRDVLKAYQHGRYGAVPFISPGQVL